MEDEGPLETFGVRAVPGGVDKRFEFSITYGVSCDLELSEEDFARWTLAVARPAIVGIGTHDERPSRDDRHVVIVGGSSGRLLAQC